MKEWRPQVFAGMLVLGAVVVVAMYLGFETIAGAGVAGIVAAVTTLSQNDKKVV